MRATHHSGRRSSQGAYSDKHNDRNYDYANAKNIDEKRTKNNIYYAKGKCLTHDEWNLMEMPSFHEIENRFYEEHFKEKLDLTNEKYIKSRHKERVKTMEQYKEANPPEETILQVGSKDDGTIDPRKMNEIFRDYIEWKEKTFPNVVIVDAAMHLDETTPHIHIREVWIGHDKDGLEMVSQGKALQEMGIERPNLEAKKDRHNNPKMTYSKLCRDKFVEICEEKGLEIEKNPKEASETGFNLLEYKFKKVEKKLEEAENEIENLTKEKFSLESENILLNAQNKGLKDDNEELVTKVQKAENEAKIALERVEALKAEIQEKETKLASLLENIPKIIRKAFEQAVMPFQSVVAKLKVKTEVMCYDSPSTVERRNKLNNNTKELVEMGNGIAKRIADKTENLKFPSEHDVNTLQNTTRIIHNMIDDFEEEEELER